MKKLLSILLLCFCFSANAENDTIMYCADPISSNYNVFFDSLDATWAFSPFNPNNSSSSYSCTSDVNGYEIVCVSPDETQIYILNSGQCIYISGCTDNGTLSNALGQVNDADADGLPAFNYNANAVIDDSSCVSVITGCMTEGYYNYNPDANVDDGNCEEFTFGCTDSTAFNYNQFVNTPINFTCYPIVYGCMFESAYNYNDYDGDGIANAIVGVNGVDVNVDDGSCISQEEFTIDSLQQALAVYEIVEEEQDYSVAFDGIDDWVNLNTWSLGQVFTIEMWVNPDSTQNSPIPNILDCSHNQWRNWTIQKLSSWSFGFGPLQNQTISYFNLDDNHWTHIAIVFDNGLSNIYVNGELVSSQMLGLITYNSPLNLNLGKWSLDSGNGGARFFTGLIDDIRISDFVRYSDTFFPCKTLIPDENTISLWNFNEGSGDIVYDISGNGNHGVIYGAEFSEDVPESYNGCTDENALNFDESAQCDNGSCVYGNEVFSNLKEDYNILNANAINSTSSLQQALDTWNTTIDLSEGWNMFGYGCPSFIDVSEGLSNHTESIIITKDNNGNVYIPEFGFNGIGDFTPGFGYQMKLTEAIEGFSLCDWYVNDIPEDNIVSLQEENDSLQAELDSIYGCKNSWACNYDEAAILNDGSCELPNGGYDCDGNNVEVGDEVYGGIVFYVDSTGQNGLVLSIEENFEHANYSEAHVFAENYAIVSYNDWYLPSVDEMYLINQGSWYSDIVFEFWSSTPAIDYANHNYTFNFSNGYPNIIARDIELKVILIRSF